MPDLFVSGISKPLLNKFRNRLNMMRDGGAKKGDLSKYAIEAIKTWLDNTTPKDRGHLLLQKELDELKAENLRLNSAENPAYRQLVKENRDMENLLQNYERSSTFSIRPEDTQEVFEILCAIPFEHRTFPADCELQRHPAIETMIRQLKDRIEKEE